MELGMARSYGGATLRKERGDARDEDAAGPGGSLVLRGGGAGRRRGAGGGGAARAGGEDDVGRGVGGVDGS